MLKSLNICIGTQTDVNRRSAYSPVIGSKKRHTIKLQSRIGWTIFHHGNNREHLLIGLALHLHGATNGVCISVELIGNALR